jgi:hypothetical protein
MFNGTRRPLTLCLLLLLIPVLYAKPQTAPENGGSKSLRLKIWLETPTYSVGDEIPVHVQVTNVGNDSVLIGNEMIWGALSPSRIEFNVVPDDGHDLTYQRGATDVPTSHASEDLASAALRWCLLLSPGYSYSATAPLLQFVPKLSRGVYKIRARYISSGVEADKYFNPLLSHPEVLAALRSESWKGEISSNAITVKIVSAASLPRQSGNR